MSDLTSLAESIDAARTRFSSLSNGFVFLDAPGGTQTPDEVAVAVGRVYREASGNTGAPYATSWKLDALVAEAREATARFLGCTADEVIFGANMTALNFTLTRTLGRELSPGDEIVVTRLDHDANVAPWLDLAADLGLTVRHADVHADTTLDLADLERQLGPRTRVVAFPWAANSTGTLVDARAVSDLAHQAGALAWVDAVQYAAHEPMDVRAIDADVVSCSAYKWCGPHLGIAYGRRDLLESWRPYKARPVGLDPVGHRFETGTLPYELLGGLLATYAYLDSLGGMARLSEWERLLGERVLAGLPAGARLYGLPTMAGRVPTFLVNFPGVSSGQLSQDLAELGFGVWSHGSYYALGLHDRIGWGEALRIGPAHYNTLDEIDRFSEALATLVARSAPARPAATTILADTGTGPDRPGLVRRLAEIPADGELTGVAAPGGELWFVISGAGRLELAGADGPVLGPDRGLSIPAGTVYRIRAAAGVGLRLDMVSLPASAADSAAGTAADSAAGTAADSAADTAVAALARDLAECEVETTGDRKFRVLFGPGRDCRVATQFVGEIPPGRAPEHSHPYDEVVLILAGTGVAHTGAGDRELAAGTCLHLRPGQPHCLENTGADMLRVLGVFHPADSPAAKLQPAG
jgi:cysteine desulfurase family protein (TIGR01976 family)